MKLSFRVIWAYSGFLELNSLVLTRQIDRHVLPSRSSLLKDLVNSWYGKLVYKFLRRKTSLAEIYFRPSLPASTWNFATATTSSCAFILKRSRVHLHSPILVFASLLFSATCDSVMNFLVSWFRKYRFSFYCRSEKFIGKTTDGRIVRVCTRCRVNSREMKFFWKFLGASLYMYIVYMW